MVVLITGITGLVGSAIARQFIEQGFEIRALVRKLADTSLITDILPKIELVEGDILDIFSIEKALENVDYVVHAAAMVSFAPKDAEKMFKINVEGTANMVNCALDEGVKKFCFISSISTFGRPASVWTSAGQKIEIDENQKWEDSDLNSNYAKSKYLAENEMWRAAAEGLNTVILNPTIVLGEGDWLKSSTQMFKYVFDQKPFYTSGGINYVDVRDVAKIAFQLTLSDIINERFAISAGDLSLKQFFEKIASSFNKKAPAILVKPWLINIIWRLEAIKSKITIKAPLITKETAKTSQLNIVYKNDKIKQTLGYDFSSLDLTINRVCDYLLIKNSVK